jgi:endonuclease/exonuclease/phosphatase family metal-dependent hydrolase
VDQATWIAERVNERLDRGAPPYRVYQTNKTGLPGLVEGIAVMSRLPMLEHGWLDLGGGNRVAQRVRLELPSGGVLDFYNTHLHHPIEDEPLRTEQARRLLAWMEGWPGVPQVLVGDFNAQPFAPTIRLISGRLRSAYAAVHGHEPVKTFPTPLSEERGGLAIVIDFIFVNDLVQVHDAWVTFDRVDPADEHLAASDHYGLAATVSVRPRD